MALENRAKQLLPVTPRWQERLLVTAILLLATFLRLYRLDQLPPGLHYDEAFNVTQAQKVLAGVERPLLFREDLTEEPMAIYITAVSFALFGARPWSLRLVSALAGIVTVAALYSLARTLFRSRAIAAVAALLLAILYWHVNFSRIGMEPIFTPLMMTLSFAYLWRGLRPIPHPPSPKGKGARGLGLLDCSLAGFFLAATQYTYKAALFVPILVAAFVVVEALAGRTFLKRYARGLTVFAVVGVLFFAPLGLYFAAHPGEFIERPSTVTAPLSGTGTLADNALKVAGMFFLRGDDNPRSNLPGRPALDPFVAIGFVAGVVVCLSRIRESESRFLLLWLVVMAVPSVLTDYAPHFGRSIGVTPALALIAAWGFAALLEKFSRFLARAQAQSREAVRAAPALILLAGLATSAYATGHAYFEVWGARTGLFDSFDVGYLALARNLRAQPANQTIYLSPVDQNHYTIQFGLAGRVARSFDGRRTLVLPPPGASAAYGVVTRDDTRTLARLTQAFPDARAVSTVRDFVGELYATILRVEGTPHLAPERIVAARLGDAVELIGYDLAREGNAIALTVYWRSLAETRDDYTAFVHLIGPLNPATQSPVWAQDDTRPGRGSFPTPRWQTGEVVIDEYRLRIPPEVAAGEYEIEMGMYILETGARVRVVDANGVPMESNRVLVERISLP